MNAKQRSKRAKIASDAGKTVRGDKQIRGVEGRISMLFSRRLRSTAVCLKMFNSRRCLRLHRHRARFDASFLDRGTSTQRLLIVAPGITGRIQDGL